MSNPQCQVLKYILCHWRFYLLYLSFSVFCSVADAQENCSNGVDDDGDGQIDCYDSDCAGQVACDSFFYGYPVNHCELQPPVGPFGVTLLWESTVTVSTRSISLVADIDADNVPEIICHSKNANQLYVLNGTTGATELTITCPAILDYSDAMAVADTDNDGFGEIYVVTANSKLHCFEHNGNPKAGYTPPNVPHAEVGPGIADFNGDGNPEIYVANEIYNSQTGALIASGGAGSSGRNTSNTSRHPVAADVLPTSACGNCGGMELVCGNTVYEVNIPGGTMMPVPNNVGPLGDGYTAVADMNMDGTLDVIVTRGGKVYVWNPVTGNQLGATFDIPGTGSGGRPNIADYDNDGYPEIGVGGSHKYVVIDYNIGTNAMIQLWQKTTVDGSQQTTGSAFDFEGDGITELVYRDENNLRVYDGATGNVKVATPCGSATRTEFPTVADANGDRYADIICNCSTNNQGGSGKVRVYKSSGFEWIPTRKVMNQHAYSITNINDDLTIPRLQQNNGDFPAINSFISQSPLFDESWEPLFIPVADFTVEIDTIRFCEVAPDQMSVTFEVCNIGSKRIMGNIPVTFYNGNPLAGGAAINTQNLTATDIDTTVCVTETFDLPWNNTPFDLYVSINDDGSSPTNAPELVYPECDSTNNIDFKNASGLTYEPVIDGLAAQYCYSDIDNPLTLTPVGGVLTGNGIAGTDFNAFDAGVGQHTITYTYTEGACDWDTTETVDVIIAPVADAGPDTSFCNGESAPIGTAPTTGFTYTWTPTSGLSDASAANPTVTLSNTGTIIITTDYIVDVESDAGCLGSDTVSVTVYPSPTADFDFTDECHNTPISFTDLSQISVGTIDAYYWDFDDFNTSSLANPTNNYVSPNTYNVSLVVESDNGCTDTVEHTVEVFNNPEADFDFFNVCPNQAADFTNTSTSLSGNITDYYWDFGDNLNTSTSSDPGNTYTVAGPYNVMLAVETNHGCVDTIVQAITVYNDPVADFSVQNVCQGVAATFNNSSSSQSGTLSQWDWYFGDGDTISTNSGNPVTHQYAVDSTYAVELIVSTQYGCDDTIQRDVVIFPVPIADFTFDSVCFGVPTTFVDASDATPGVIDQWNWNFGGIGSSSSQNTDFIFPNPGQYSVILSVETDSGCANATENSITVYDLPEPDFSSNKVCVYDTTQFTNESDIASGIVSSQMWYFGDSETSVLYEPVHVYPQAGFYTATLVATSDKNCVDSVSHEVEVYPRPDISYKVIPDTGCMPLQVNFLDESTIASGYNITQWNWNFGNERIDFDPNTETIYDTAGFYNVTLEVISANGCSSVVSDSDRVEVFPTPVANFVATPQPASILLPEVQFTDKSSLSVAWDWVLTDFDYSIEQNPFHVYDDTGTYFVQQIVLTEHACADTVTIPIIIEEAFTMYIPSAFTPGKDGINDEFLCYGEGFTDFELRIFNRWGEQLFFTTDKNKGWNGRKHNVGEIVEGGTYIYQVQVMDFEKHPHKFRGQVNLIK